MTQRGTPALVLALLLPTVIGCEPRAGLQIAGNESTELAMRELAGKVGELDGILRSVRPLEAFDQDRVAVLLREIDELSTGLEQLPPGAHPPLANLGRLRADVRRAREGVEADPPDYYFAGAVSGACVYCHSHPL